jgi:hypothetical protein
VVERAEEITPLGAQSARTREVPDAKSDVKRTAGSYVAMSLVLQFALLATLAVGGYFLRGEIERLIRDTGTAADKSAATSDRVGELSAQTDALRAEITQLHDALASGTGEDVLFLKIILLEPKVDAALARTIATSVHRNAMLYEKDPNLVLAIISVESDFNPKAVSSTGAVGLMQVMPHWKRILNIQGDLTDPEISIRYGLQVLGFYEDMYKDLETVLTAYNRGPGPVDKALMRNTSAKTDYAPRVMATYDRLRKLNVVSAGR